MTNPCVDFCYNHWGKQYSSECDENCEFAQVCKENKRLKRVIEMKDKAFITSIALSFLLGMAGTMLPFIIGKIVFGG